jgi:hypothetical protein
LEHFRKNCSQAVGEKEEAVFLSFGFVSAQLQGLSNLLLRQSLAKNSKILAPHGYSFSSNALNSAEAAVTLGVFFQGG